ncbi:MAG: PD-(D/E)XK nuclease family protein [Saprospiraceae bacterium]|nr:PD-(D/E)XK nuclease family protein [Saprospiraceae bacterium]
MTLHFGLEFDGNVHAQISPTLAGEYWLGPAKLLLWMEERLGLSGYPNNTDYLRIELYRQSLGQLTDSAFFAASYNADRFATAAALLAWRDELLLSGWNFTPNAGCPQRLTSLAQVEQVFQKKLSDPSLGARAYGWADRFQQALEAAAERPIRPEKILLYEPRALYPPHLLRLWDCFSAQGCPIEVVEQECSAPPATRLGALQQRLLTGAPVQAGFSPDDRSLLILHARRDSDAAVLLAQILADNSEVFRPLLLIPELDRSLENTLVLEQQAAMGILSSSLARPSLQVLKLAPAFLWEPVDVFKIMEFVTLSVKPLDDGLALEIARVLAEKPGLFSDNWFGAVYSYLEQGELPADVRRQYEFWFDRRRYRPEAGVPVRDAIGIYNYLHTWALQHFDQTGSKNTSLLVLAEQARRIKDLLEALPEPRVGFLELERIVRTIYEPSPVQISTAEAGSLSYIHRPGAMATACDQLLWWNCLFTDPTPAPDKWQSDERQYLENEGVALDTPKQQSRRTLLLQYRPVLQTREQLVLVAPDQVRGADAVPSLLLGDIEAAFEETSSFTYRLDEEPDRARLAQIWELPEPVSLPVRRLQRTPPHLHLQNPELIPDSEYETPTQLEALFYHPHRWFFRQKMKLYPASLLSVKSDTTLLGNLAHRFFEILLKEDLSVLDKTAIGQWVEEQAQNLLSREGATLLLYGREPERRAFLNKVKNAAWSLINLLRNNGWTVEGTEIELNGELAGVAVRGKADLVLRRGEERAVVDLKWSGVNRRREMIRNGEDLQLVLYSRLLPPVEQWAHTAYFILEEGKIIARNRAAFADAMVPDGAESDHTTACAAIFAKMERTFRWRMEQVSRGRIELRTARNAAELDELYADENLFDLLEMKQEDARWDDYGALLEFRSPAE